MPLARIPLIRTSRRAHRKSYGQRTLAVAVLVVSLLVGNCSAFRGAADNIAHGRAALRTGDYAQARKDFEAAIRSEPGLESGEAGLLETLRLTGSYREAIRRADEFLSRREDSAALHFERGRSRAALGDYAAAETDLRRAIELARSDSTLRMDAVRELALLLDDLGRPEAERLWEGLLDEYRAGRAKGSRQLGDVAMAAWKRGYTQDAKDLFMDATDSKQEGEISLEVLSNFGYLFLEKYEPKEATGVFRDCLKINESHPDALLGIALAKKYESSDEVENNARAALKFNPNLVPALTLLAELRMQEENYDAANEEIRRALAVNPSSLDALSLEAVYYQFHGDLSAFSQVEKKILEINPSYGRLYYRLAESLVSHRKYQEAVDFDRKAVALDPKLWPAFTSLGMNLTRIGDLAGGRQALEKAFSGDPHDVWAFNSLELMDQLDKFTRTESPHFVYRMSKEDEPVLTPYASKLAEEVYAKLTERYGFIPKGPIELEVFPDHAGFAVRTLGLPGLGALGVCFGKVVAIDSPRARKGEAFNWGSTLWHEFTHVITLQMTDYNIPRWYSEGLSVYEEHRARPGWGDDLNSMILRTYKQGKLLKVSELNAGMMRPKSIHQIGISYYQASLVCQMIADRFGFDKIRQSLLLFAQNKSSNEVFKEALGWDMATMDAEYARYLHDRLEPLAAHLDFSHFAPGEPGQPVAGKPDKSVLSARVKENPDDFFANLQLGLLLHKEKADSEAEPYLKKAEQLFPQFTEPGNPYQALSRIYLQQKRADEALAQFQAWMRFDENNPEPLIGAARIYRERKDWAAASKTLELEVYIDPYDADIQQWLGDAAVQDGAWPAAIAAFQALVGLHTTDPAAAHYSLSRALLGAGKRVEAKKEVLRSLEIAPTFAKAQDLLLKLTGGAP